jgi:hypothetical protein
MVHAPVGIRCPDCSGVRPVPTYDVSAAFMARAIGAGVVLAIAGGAIVSALIWFVPIPFLWSAATAGLGYVVGEGISIAANRKRGRNLKFIAAGATLGALIGINFATGGFFVFFGTGVTYNLFGLLAGGLAIYIAVHRF